MRIELLGPLVVEREGERVEVPGARLRALLVQLALAGGRPVDEARLAAVVWPDEPPADPRAALRTLVSRLRRALGDANVSAHIMISSMLAGVRARLGEQAAALELAAQASRAACERGGSELAAISLAVEAGLHRRAGGRTPRGSSRSARSGRCGPPRTPCSAPSTAWRSCRPPGLCWTSTRGS